MLDLNKLESKLDKALNFETEKSLNDFLTRKRIIMAYITRVIEFSEDYGGTQKIVHRSCSSTDHNHFIYIDEDGEESELFSLSDTGLNKLTDLINNWRDHRGATEEEKAAVKRLYH